MVSQALSASLRCMLPRLSAQLMTGTDTVHSGVQSLASCLETLASEPDEAVYAEMAKACHDVLQNLEAARPVETLTRQTLWRTLPRKDRGKPNSLSREAAQKFRSMSVKELEEILENRGTLPAFFDSLRRANGLKGFRWSRPARTLVLIGRIRRAGRVNQITCLTEPEAEKYQINDKEFKIVFTWDKALGEYRISTSRGSQGYNMAISFFRGFVGEVPENCVDAAILADALACPTIPYDLNLEKLGKRLQVGSKAIEDMWDVRRTHNKNLSERPEKLYMVGRVLSLYETDQKICNLSLTQSLEEETVDDRHGFLIEFVWDEIDQEYKIEKISGHGAYQIALNYIKCKFAVHHEFSSIEKAIICAAWGYNKYKNKEKVYLNELESYLGRGSVSVHWLWMFKRRITAGLSEKPARLYLVGRLNNVATEKRFVIGLNVVTEEELGEIDESRYFAVPYFWDGKSYQTGLPTGSEVALQLASACFKAQVTKFGLSKFPSFSRPVSYDQLGEFLADPVLYMPFIQWLCSSQGLPLIEYDSLPIGFRITGNKNSGDPHKSVLSLGVSILTSRRPPKFSSNGFYLDYIKSKGGHYAIYQAHGNGALDLGARFVAGHFNFDYPLHPMERALLANYWDIRLMGRTPQNSFRWIDAVDYFTDLSRTDPVGDLWDVRTTVRRKRTQKPDKLILAIRRKGSAKEVNPGMTTPQLLLPEELERFDSTHHMLLTFELHGGAYYLNAAQGHSSFDFVRTYLERSFEMDLSHPIERAIVANHIGYILRHKDNYTSFTRAELEAYFESHEDPFLRFWQLQRTYQSYLPEHPESLFLVGVLGDDRSEDARVLNLRIVTDLESLELRKEQFVVEARWDGEKYVPIKPDRLEHTKSMSFYHSLIGRQMELPLGGQG